MSSTTSTSRPAISPRRSFSTRTLARRGHAVAVGGDLEEVDLDGQVELAHEVGDEDEAAAQEPHHHELVGALERRRDLARERLDARAAIDLAEIILSMT